MIAELFQKDRLDDQRAPREHLREGELSRTSARRGREATARFSAELVDVLRSASVDPSAPIARLDDLYR